MPDAGQEQPSGASAHRITWFTPDRPVGGTVNVWPARNEATTGQVPVSHDADS